MTEALPLPISSAKARLAKRVRIDLHGRGRYRRHLHRHHACSDSATGRQWRAKTPSTPADPSEAFLTGVQLALAEAGARPQEIGRVLHGTTVATNLILEGKTARTALVTTAGFRHVLEIGRQDIPRHANLFTWVKPKRPVPPARVLEVRERSGPGGVVLAPLDETSVHEVAAALRRLDVQAVAICLLHSFAYPAHERRVAELLRAALPEVAVTASVDVLPVVREYERSLATIMNAGVMPAVGTYIQRLRRRLTDADITAPLLLMQSNGGVAGAATIGRAPALTVLSGPAAGVVGARDVAAAAGIGDIVTVDIGGTSADICLLRGGQIALTQRGHIGEWPLPLPMVDMVTIGAGGGSIARLSDGALTVGPASAGAMPGPACYGTGGEQPTVTDAHLCSAICRRRCSAAGCSLMRRWRSAPFARASPNRSGCRCTMRRGAFWRSPIPTWWARSAWCRWSGDMIRATSRWCRSVAPARCMAARSRNYSASSACWCRPRRVCCARKDCWRRR